ncbi:Eco57I restriction-modification methylase domain-containing protein [Nocardia sp. CA-107356]|uniref:Eco57I restriction-modification methylase domain-containing protein n=1 Tax=Nocardia sp. CA-107356 TaxID=3239972 RepID=UPI003D90DF76
MNPGDPAARDRKRHGRHYTPPALAGFLAQRLVEHLPRPGGGGVPGRVLRVLDPACGDGELLLALHRVAGAVLPGVRVEMVGYDLDGAGVAVARERAEAAEVAAEWHVGDFLTASVGIADRSFDAIITNPPYVRTQQLGGPTAQLISKQFGLRGRIDLTHPFVAVAPRLLRPDGVLGLLCANRFLTTKAGANIRSLLLTELSPVELYDLGDTKLFEAAVLPAVTIATRTPSRAVCRYVSAYEVDTAETISGTDLFEALTAEHSHLVTHAGRAFAVEVGTLATDDQSRDHATARDRSANDRAVLGIGRTAVDPAAGSRMLLGDVTVAGDRQAAGSLAVAGRAASASSGEPCARQVGAESTTGRGDLGGAVDAAVGVVALGNGLVAGDRAAADLRATSGDMAVPGDRATAGDRVVAGQVMSAGAGAMSGRQVDSDVAASGQWCDGVGALGSGGADGVRDRDGSAGKGAWRMSRPGVDGWLGEVEAGTWRTFGDVGRIRVGIKTTADRVFISDRWGEVEPRPEGELLFDLITHHDVEPWRISRERATRVLYPYDPSEPARTPVDLREFPGAAAYLEKNRETLAGRKYLTDSGREWFEIWVPQRPHMWRVPKVVFPDISERPRFALDRSGAVVNGDCYWISLADLGVDGAAERLAYLLMGVANSALGLRFYDAVCGNRLYSGRRRWITQYVSRLPLPDPTTMRAGGVVELVRDFVDGGRVPDANSLRLLDEWVAFAFGPRVYEMR